jgi:hypothetical protein
VTVRERRLFAGALAAAAAVVLLANTAASSVAPAVGIGWSDLAGPLGGVVAAAFAGGAVAGYGFCVRTILKFSNSRIASLEATVIATEAECATRINRLEWRLDRSERRNRQYAEMLMGQRPVGKLSADFDDDQLPPDDVIERHLKGLSEGD